jgi:hypothetical protein
LTKIVQGCYPLAHVLGTGEGLQRTGVLSDRIIDPSRISVHETEIVARCTMLSRIDLEWHEVDGAPESDLGFAHLTHLSMRRTEGILSARMLYWPRSWVEEIGSLLQGSDRATEVDGAVARGDLCPGKTEVVTDDRPLEAADLRGIPELLF